MQIYELKKSTKGIALKTRNLCQALRNDGLG